jgi:hypothetical protein
MPTGGRSRRAWLENRRRAPVEVLLPLLPGAERRRSHQSVGELRRQLREADRQRFELEAALSGAARRWLEEDPHVQPPALAQGIRTWHRPAATALLAVCMCGASIEWAPRLESRPPGSRVTVELRGVGARVVQKVPAESASIPAAPALVLASRPVARLRVERQIGARGHSFKHHGQEQTPTRVLHPLSPGEFGRRPGSLRGSP